VSRNLREYTRNTQIRLIFGFLLLVFLVGDGLIYVFYGKGAALVGLGCILGALLPVGIITLFFWITERILEKRK